MLPTRAQREDFIKTYVRAYFSYRDAQVVQETKHNGATANGSAANGIATAVATDGNGTDEPKDVAAASVDEDAEVARLSAEVDLFRGVPGFYWGIWALIQAKISQIDFDYAGYAETRLGEYWAWRGKALDGGEAPPGGELPLRERRWAQDV